MDFPVRARNIAAATADAPFMPSGWLWLGSALFLASARTSSSVSKAHATGETRIAEPLPKLSPCSFSSERHHLKNLSPYPAFG